MDFLNRSFDQIKDLFTSITPGARITAGLLLVVIVVSLVFLFQGPMSSSGNFLLGGRAFSVSELEAIEGAFAKAGLSNYELEGNRVRVPAAKKAEYIAALAENDALPANFSDIFAREARGASPFETKEQAEQRWRTAKQRELAMTISHIRGISMAQVIYDEVEKPGFPRKIEKTATVAVKAIGNTELEQHQIRAVRHLVSAAFAGLQREDVTITDLNTGRSHGGSGGEFATIEEDPYFERKRYYERLWQEKIAQTVDFVPGVEVTVDVTLKEDTLLREDTVTVDPKPVTFESNTVEKSSVNSKVGPRGRPGVVAQQNGAANQGSSIGGAANESKTEETKENIRRIGGHTRTVRDTAALVPKKVTAVVGVPSSYYLKIWNEQNPAAPGEEPEKPDAQQLAAIENQVVTKIEDMVVTLLPEIDRTEDKYPLVKVKTVDTLTPEPIEPPGLAQNAGAWLADNWSTIGMMLVGTFGLFLLRGMVKQRPAPPPAAAETSGDRPRLSVVGDEEEEHPAEEEQARARRFANASTNVREELAAMVRENPDAAANILRSWIGEAS